MASTKVEVLGGELVVQGFRGSAINSIEPYVFIGIVNADGGLEPIEGFELTPENAHILSEEIRKQAEFSNNQEEK